MAVVRKCWVTTSRSTELTGSVCVLCGKHNFFLQGHCCCIVGSAPPRMIVIGLKNIQTSQSVFCPYSRMIIGSARPFSSATLHGGLARQKHTCHCHGVLDLGALHTIYDIASVTFSAMISEFKKKLTSISENANPEVLSALVFWCALWWYPPVSHVVHWQVCKKFSS